MASSSPNSLSILPPTPPHPSSDVVSLCPQNIANLVFMFLVLAALGLRCCTPAFSSCGERGLLFVVVHGLLIVVASLVAEHGL